MKRKKLTECKYLNRVEKNLLNFKKNFMSNFDLQFYDLGEKSWQKNIFSCIITQ